MFDSRASLSLMMARGPDRKGCRSRILYDQQFAFEPIQGRTGAVCGRDSSLRGYRCAIRSYLTYRGSVICGKDVRAGDYRIRHDSVVWKSATHRGFPLDVSPFERHAVEADARLGSMGHLRTVVV